MLFFDQNCANEHRKDQKTSVTTSTLELLRSDLQQTG